MLIIMTSRRLPPFAAASMLLALFLAGCSAPHDMSLAESCKQWNQLKNGKWADVRDDFIAAEPKMHEAVAKQLRIYVEALGEPGSKELGNTDAAFASYDRLVVICGK
jgi:hypothetical protein